MPDPYLYKDVPVLRNKLNIKDEHTLDLVEAEQSRANMMILYERACAISTGFSLATSTTGPENTAKSTLKKRSGSWEAAASGILMMK